MFGKLLPFVHNVVIYKSKTNMRLTVMVRSLHLFIICVRTICNQRINRSHI